MVVMVVDYSSTRRELICHAIQRLEGMVVIEATDGADGLAKLDDIHPDLIVTDLDMPNLDGFGFIELLRRRPGHETTSVVVLVTEGATEDHDRAHSLGVRHYLTKPVRRHDLVSVVSEVMGAHPARGSRAPTPDPSAIVLRVDYENVDELLADYASTLSKCEIVVSNGRALSEGTAVCMSLSFPGLAEPILLDGAVRSSVPGAEPILNIRLTDQAQCSKLASIVETIRARHS